MTREEIVEGMKLLEDNMVHFDELQNDKGEWIEREGWDGDVYYECSVCGEPFCLIEGTPIDNMYNYCPNCGAKMESENKE